MEFSNIQGNDISTETINTINVDDIVTTKSSSVISSLKTFSKLQSDVIDVTGEINGVSTSVILICCITNTKSIEKLDGQGVTK